MGWLQRNGQGVGVAVPMGVRRRHLLTRSNNTAAAEDAPAGLIPQSALRFRRPTDRDLHNSRRRAVACTQTTVLRWCQTRRT